MVTPSPASEEADFVGAGVGLDKALNLPLGVAPACHPGGLQIQGNLFGLRRTVAGTVGGGSPNPQPLGEFQEGPGPLNVRVVAKPS